jgi:hypothetical protein
MEDGRSIVWKLPVYNTIHHILTNPIDDYKGVHLAGPFASQISLTTFAMAPQITTLSSKACRHSGYKKPHRRGEYSGL